MSRRFAIRSGWWGWLVLLLLALSAPAQLATNAPPSHAMLWVVKGGHNTVYLLGSVHLLRNTDYPLHASVEAAYRDSQVLVTEVDIARMDTPATQRAFVRRGQFSDGKTLRDVLPPQTYAATQRTCADLHLDLASCQSVKPWLLAMSLTLLKLSELGFSPTNGVDVYFDARARRDGKTLAALETVDEQLALFDTLPARDAVDLLQYTLKEVGALDAEMDRLVDAWTRGDTEVLTSILLEDFQNFPHLEQRLLIDRNRAWTSAIATYLKADRNYMIVVGAAHLVGPSGVVSLLRQAGYAAEQR